MEEIRLSEYADIFSGYAFSTNDMKDEGVPILKIGNINSDGTITLTSDSNYPHDVPKKLDKFWLRQSDILVCMTGATIGKIGRSFCVKEKQCLVNQRVGIIRSKDNINNDYLYYILTLSDFKRYIEIVGSGAAQANISASDIAKFTLQCNRNEKNQIKIAKTLSNYDQLIENNRKRIKVLEQMAEELYKEWFVRFRFPGYENTKFENRIPLNWKYEKFSSIYSCYRGISYSSDEIECDEGVNLINLKNISAYGGFRRDGVKRYDGKYKTEHCVKYNDLVMGVTDMTQDRRTVGYVALIPKINGVISADLVKIISGIDNIFSYCLFRFGFYSKLFSQFGNGANVIHLKPSSIKNQKILIPNKELIDKFVRIAKPIFDEIEILNIKIEQLIKQRDTLLPRLMNGKLSVEGKEII